MINDIITKRNKMKVLEIFKKITTIPHCSENTDKLKKFIIDFSKKHGFTVETDEIGNILCYKRKRELCLQSHYDMVCVGKAPDIEIIQKDGFLTAKDSSLGADNGIGVALMLYLISKNIENEYLFTNDEEVGLLGAQNIELDLKSKYMVNLDSEEFGSIFIGCAGGVDIFASKKATKENIKFSKIYKIYTKKFPGGHSGVDIDKDIPNAIKELARFISKLKEFQIIDFIGGERINSIPAYAKALIATDENQQETDNILVEKIEFDNFSAIKDGKKYISFIEGFAHGVRACDFDLKIPKTSINLALTNINEKEIYFAFSARSMENEKLTEIESETKALLDSLDLKAVSEGKYPAWQPRVLEFAKKVKKIYKKHFKDVKFKAIHAGLESAILSKKYPNIQIVSIGPDIYNPHSIREKVKIDSIEKITKVVEDIVKSI